MRFVWLAMFLALMSSPASAEYQRLFENNKTLVALQDDPQADVLHQRMVAIRESENGQAHLMLVCADKKHLRASVVYLGITLKEMRRSVVLSYVLDDNEEKRIHGAIFPYSDKRIQFIIDPVHLRQVAKTNTPFYRDIQGRKRLKTQIRVGEKTFSNSFELGDILPWTLKLAERCQVDVRGG